jgi:H+/Cl- antiporter ClcA
MDHDKLFFICNTMALFSWLQLIFAPHSKATKRLLHTGLIPIFLCLAYFVNVVVAYLSGAPGGFGSIQEVAILFDSKDWLLAGWIHYLAFDLLAGVWMVNDAKRYGIKHLFTIPLLVLTFFLGPIGILTYWLWRTARSKKMVQLF